MSRLGAWLTEAPTRSFAPTDFPWSGLPYVSSLHRTSHSVTYTLHEENTFRQSRQSRL